MSGAGRIKGDFSTDDYVIEHKDARQQYALKLSDIKAINTYAIREGKEPLMMIKFSDGYTAIVTIERQL